MHNKVQKTGIWSLYGCLTVIFEYFRIILVENLSYQINVCPETECSFNCSSRYLDQLYCSKWKHCNCSVFNWNKLKRAVNNKLNQAVNIKTIYDLKKIYIYLSSLRISVCNCPSMVLSTSTQSSTTKNRSILLLNTPTEKFIVYVLKWLWSNH